MANRGARAPSAPLKHGYKQKSQLGEQLLTSKGILSTLFDFLDPDDDKSLNMFFTNKNVFKNIEIMASRIREESPIGSAIRSSNQFEHQRSLNHLAAAARKNQETNHS